MSKKPTSTKKESHIVLTKNELDILVQQIEVGTIEKIEHSEEYSAPIPHPNHMKAYQDIDESFPDRILKMAESNLKHKQSIEKNLVVGEILMGILGWATPSVLAFYVLYHAIAFTKEGKSIEALISLIAVIATLTGAVYMKNKVDNTEATEST